MAKPSQTLQVLQHLHDHALQQKLAIEDLMILTRRFHLTQLAQLIRDNVKDPAVLNDIADQLDSKGSELTERPL